MNKNDSNEKCDDYLAIDIITFIKRFVGEHKVNLDIENLIQFLNKDKDNFNNSMYSIINSLGTDKTKDIYKKSNIKESKDNNNICNNINEKN